MLHEKSQPGAVNFYTEIGSSVHVSRLVHSRNHTIKISAPQNIFIPLLNIKWTFPYPRALHTNIIKNSRKTILNKKPNNI